MRAPISTYRLQLHKNFGFEAAAAVVPYLAELGISEAYVSPILKAAPGSTHGYDVIDPTELNPELGGEAGFARLTSELERQGLGLIVDFVPNHLGVGCAGNRLWEDVLEHGRASEYAEYFDIDWSPPKETLAQKLLLPILPDQYGIALEQGLFKLVLSEGGLGLSVSERALPLAPRSLGPLVSRLCDLLEPQGELGWVERLRASARAFQELPAPNLASATELAEYRRAARSAKQDLRAVMESGQCAAAIAEGLEVLSGVSGRPETFDFLDELLRAQNYRLSSWRLALEAVNYRRFFDVNELASIRVELAPVFELVHGKLFALLRAGAVSGIRLDHIDGLYDPIGYLRQLQQRLSEVLELDPEEASPSYVIVEKILASDERLPPELRVHGATGYDFMRVLTGVFVDRRAERKLTATYRAFSGDLLDLDLHVLAAKRLVLRDLLASELNTLSRELERLAELDRRSRDFSWQTLHLALAEVMAALSVYRTYIRPDGTHSDEDERRIGQALALALRRNPTAPRAVYHFLRSTLLASGEGLARQFVLRFQQTSGPVMAKAVEDTAFYRSLRLVAENEVGSHPEALGVPASAFHAQNSERQTEHKLAMIASSTHDNKRGEDVRARLSVLAQMPGTWRQTVFALSAAATRYRAEVEGEALPSRADEYLYYQTLVGVFPFGGELGDPSELCERLQAYMVKASREAKVRTSWIDGDAAYEEALTAFVAATLADAEFLSCLRRFCQRLDPYAVSSALGQVALKLCAPGVPDTYQGAERWHQVLVDPDNRRAVDYDECRRALRRVRAHSAEPGFAARVLERFADGDVKLWVTHTLLELRRDGTALRRGRYSPLEAPECIAFSREDQDEQIICLVPRFAFRVTRGRSPWPVGPVWGEACLEGEGVRGPYRNVFDGQVFNVERRLRLADALASFPLAVLKRL
jgi:(1->4)-alpha-D-glucan 1-alpha-D-glucosylmutase